ncbi:MAG: agmatine deiminase family protein [Flavobacteriales bacterium]|nr:agmatine deiminase family protein [Flavobacteriales bacterium]
MKKTLLSLTGIFMLFSLVAQENNENVIPHHLTWEEIIAARQYDFSQTVARGIETPPEFENLRTPAEWEEQQALVIGWEGYPQILKQITAAARLECEVIILTEDEDQTIDFLYGNSAGGPFEDLTNVTVIETDLNTIWMRDYAATTVYGNEVDQAFLVDWIYNRPRPDDDASPAEVAEHLDLPLYCTTSAPYDLMGTGGNWMTDGFGLGFSSELIMDENEGGNTWWGTQYPDQTEDEIDEIFNLFMGINEYVKMDNLPYDGIHHIDMHLKMLDEETLLWAEYPEGVADGPQIEANIEYVLSNYTTKWGTPFKVIRVPSPPQFGNNDYPDDGGWYLTYTNSVFVNKTVLLPTYYTEYDTTAIRIYEEALPGYNIVGIDCDTSPNNIIALSGAIHCITHEVGADDPLLISHQALPDTEDDQNPYPVVAYMAHRDGVVNGTLYYKTSLDGDYQSVSMSDIGDGNWQGDIPAQPFGTTVYYYVQGEAADGKVQVRPMPAPEGYWEFDVVNEIVFIEENEIGAFAPAFPNPANAITCVPLTLNQEMDGILKISDVTGRTIEVIHRGSFPSGETKYFFNASEMAQGAYLIEFVAGAERFTQRIMVK